MAKKLVRSAWGKSGNSSIQSGAKAALDGAGSATSPEYQARITAAFAAANIPGASNYVDPNAAAQAQYKALLEGATNTANTTYKNTLADSVAGEGTTALDLGATLTARDPSMAPEAATQGDFNWGGVEATNPFSKAALLVRNYHQQQGRTTNGLAAQGQLYSGAMKNAQAQDTFGFQGGQDQLYKALQGYLAGQARNRRDAGTTRDSSINSAGLTGLGTLLGS